MRLNADKRDLDNGGFLLECVSDALPGDVEIIPQPTVMKTTTGFLHFGVWRHQRVDASSPGTDEPAAAAAAAAAAAGLPSTPATSVTASPAAFSPPSPSGSSSASPRAPSTTLAVKQVPKSVATSLVSLSGARIADNPMREMSTLERVNREWPLVSSDPMPFVKLHAVLETDADYWLIMDKASHTLFDLVGAASVARTRKWVRQLLGALRQLHRWGMCFRDVSLENCLITAHDDLVLCDFGMVVPLDGDGRVPGGPIAGKSMYMSPASLRHGASFLGEAHDVWSAGVVAFALNTGSPPFRLASAACPCFALKRADVDRYRQWVLDSYPQTSSPEALDFCLAVLEEEEKARPSIDALLDHPWLTSECAAADAAVAGPAAGSPV